jgi:hypothetical protein
MQQALDAPQADTELLSYRRGCGARPVEIDHYLKIIQREAVTQMPRADHALWSDPCTRVVVLTAVWQDRSHHMELF